MLVPAGEFVLRREKQRSAYFLRLAPLGDTNLQRLDGPKKPHSPIVLALTGSVADLCDAAKIIERGFETYRSARIPTPA
jgi:hypothetical protein